MINQAAPQLFTELDVRDVFKPISKLHGIKVAFILVSDSCFQLLQDLILSLVGCEGIVSR